MPCFENEEALHEIDDAVRDAFVSSCCLSIDGNSWDRATLPPKSGGIGLRSAADIALPQFLASVCATRSVSEILCHDAPDLAFERARTLWQNQSGLELPPDTASSPLAWSEPLLGVKLDRVKSNMGSSAEIARLLSASTPESASLWTAVPSARQGTRLMDSVFTVAAGLRLGLPVASAGVCRCGHTLDRLGEHALVCKRGTARGARHRGKRAYPGRLVRGRRHFHSRTAWTRADRWQAT